MKRRLAILGGMFNPVHNGHLRVAVECRDAFNFDELRMMPCAEPPHREKPDVSPQQRLDMLKLALENVDGIEADGRELSRSGYSYTVDTLDSLKAEFPQASVYLIFGSDTFQSLDTWHSWEKILKLANVIIAQRPDTQDNLSSKMGKLLKDCFTTDLATFEESPFGLIYILKVSQLDISSSQIRKMFREKKSVQFLLPEIVLSYIKQNKIY